MVFIRKFIVHELKVRQTWTGTLLNGSLGVKVVDPIEIVSFTKSSNIMVATYQPLSTYVSAVVALTESSQVSWNMYKVSRLCQTATPAYAYSTFSLICH